MSQLRKSKSIHSRRRDGEQGCPSSALSNPHGDWIRLSDGVVLQQSCKLCNGGSAEHSRDTYLTSGSALNFSHQSGGEQRVPPNIEEVIVNSDIRNSKHLLPNLEELLLKRIVSISSETFVRLGCSRRWKGNTCLQRV